MSQTSLFSGGHLRKLSSWIKERLWVRPLAMSLISVAGIFLADLADGRGFGSFLPEISMDSVESLLSIMASSMLVIATFAVGSMVAAYASASTVATPRSFSLVLADDVTQNALSAFVGAFIFSLVSLIAVKNGRYDSAGLFAIFALTVGVFALVIGTFVRWVDRIARLGRVSNTIEKLERATTDALNRRRHAPNLGATDLALRQTHGKSVAVCSPQVGYVQHVDMGSLQSTAEKLGCQVLVAALPGAFVSRSRPILHVEGLGSFQPEAFSQAFTIDRERAFSDDPRFGLLALSEIADKALSAGINDPGTAIDILGTLVRLFTLWQQPPDQKESPETLCDRVFAPRLSTDDLFDDAFTAIAREGAGIVEVSVRLQKALRALDQIDDPAMRSAARKHSRLALSRSELAMTHPYDIERAREAAAFSASPV